LVDPDAAELRSPPNGATQFKSVPLVPEALLTLPGWEESELEPILGDPYARDNDPYNAAHEAIDGAQSATRHRLFGWPDLIQGPMEDLVRTVYATTPWAQVAPATNSRWRLVLQIDTDDGAVPGYIWGDVGRLYFWMRQVDLAEQAFDRAWMISQCS
jgi:hypothetical protein